MSSVCEALAISAVDKRLFEDLLRKHHRQAYSLAYRMTGSEADAEDLVQEAFLRAYRFFERYDARLPFSSWLYRIMTNAHIDAVRRRARLRTVSLDEPLKGEHGETALAWELPDTADNPEEKLMSELLDADIQKALLDVPAPFRIAVVLADIEGLSYEEIAEVMKCSVGTVRSRIHRGRKLLRKSLAGRSTRGASSEPRCAE
jgi:RNA polymerase sigma-70 factor (ECF subfamily)